MSEQQVNISTKPTCLGDWLTLLEQRHPSVIDMGLDRVGQVAQRLFPSLSQPIITVGGTNGKGSVCGMLSTILKCAGYKVGTYTSPHLIHYNERVAVDLVPASDEAIVASFDSVEHARGDVSLTYFEFGTLAAVRLFEMQDVDVIVLEVGLGGRLDAVNVFEPIATAVVSIDLDHQSYLGNTREAIGFEKAGIFRSGIPALCSDPSPPQSVLEHASQIDADLRLIGRDYGFQSQQTQWSYWGQSGSRKHGLPFPALRGAYQLSNATTAIALLDCVKEVLPVSLGDIKRGLLEVEVRGRFQVLPGRPAIVLDVAHNPHAAKAFVHNLDNMGYFKRTLAVFGIMADKDVAGVLQILGGRIDHWYLANLPTGRAATAMQLSELIGLEAGKPIDLFETISAAYAAACKDAGENDRIVVFGSHYTVAEVLLARN
ncbi:bifunctional tetrahydrofolate synthase/dihydrofolate synthase [Parachitinimonas caeni]|uniref:Dihydrofolate synthase/folylpolyglutamate synthase n=1 Tax=Parachitinimonas caeni TaxID=3031301 RepID=A0ABT7E453_9NEIS|nr:bifunctional tetrahydrofolate synthase/dihydrofolate synthase [Parachitinimonas caeni]MDK2126190.1 bifunctional tetrahydrofolate synthase/dihydrofolate synthase [Parachitinimonas caeni]